MRKLKFKFNSVVSKYLFIAIAILVLFFISYGVFSIFSPSKEEMYLYDLMDSIKDTNNQCKSFLDDSNINVEKALKTIPKMREQLYSTSIDSTSNEYAAIADNSATYLNISRGLNENILLLDQLQAMLNNPYGNDLELASTNLKIYRDASDSYYNLVEYDNSNFSLGNSMYSMINETIDYCISSNNTKKMNEIKSAEADKFISTLNELVVSMDKLIENYYERVIDCRSNKMTYELLVSKLDDTISKMESVKNILSQMSIPNDFLDIYNSFSEVSTLYSKYVYDVKYAILTEMVRRESVDIKDDYMDSLYDSSNKTLENVEKKYKIFTKEYNKLNDNY